jgi:hypothetical protein
MKNRRNALIGWMTLMVGKKLILMKLRKAPEPEPKLTKTHKGLIAGVVAVVVGALVWMRVRPSGGGEGDGDSGMIPPYPPVAVTEPEPAATD